MPHWNSAPESLAIVTPFAHQMYLKSREVMDRLRKSDAEKAEQAIKESVGTTK